MAEDIIPVNIHLFHNVVMLATSLFSFYFHFVCFLRHLLAARVKGAGRRGSASQLVSVEPHQLWLKRPMV